MGLRYDIQQAEALNGCSNCIQDVCFVDGVHGDHGRIAEEESRQMANTKPFVEDHIICKRALTIIFILVG